MPAPDRRQPRTDARPQKRFFAQLRSAGSGQIEMRRSPLASGGAAAVGPQSTGVCRLRGEPRQCGVRAHRLIPPSLAPTGERRPSMACLRPIPAPPRLSPPGCPWLRRSRHRQHEGNARRSEKRHAAKDATARGFRPSGTWMYRARVLEQDAEPRGGRNPLAAAAPARRRDSRSGSAKSGPMSPQLGEEPRKSPARGGALSSTGIAAAYQV